MDNALRNENVNNPFALLLEDRLRDGNFVNANEALLIPGED